MKIKVTGRRIELSDDVKERATLESRNWRSSLTISFPQVWCCLRTNIAVTVN